MQRDTISAASEGYKYNKKLGIASRLAGHILDQPVINPLTGEIMAEAGETVSYDKACEIEPGQALSTLS